MDKLSPASKEKLETADPRLQLLINEVAKKRRLVVACGHRGEAEQRDLYENEYSRVQYPNSKHNSYPALAVDVYPLTDGKINWQDTRLHYEFAGYVRCMADTLGYVVRWGGDWDGDGEFADQTFNDLGHFEIVE